jgi:hypothetical protein
MATVQKLADKVEISNEMRALAHKLGQQAATDDGHKFPVTITDTAIKLLYAAVHLEMTYLFRDAYERALEGNSHEVSVNNIRGAFELYGRYSDDQVMEALQRVKNAMAEEK